MTLLETLENITSKAPLEYSLSELRQFVLDIAEAAKATTPEDLPVMMVAVDIAMQLKNFIRLCEAYGVDHVSKLPCDSDGFIIKPEPNFGEDEDFDYGF